MYFTKILRLLSGLKSSVIAGAYFFSNAKRITSRTKDRWSRRQPEFKPEKLSGTIITTKKGVELILYDSKTKCFFMAVDERPGGVWMSNPLVSKVPLKKVFKKVIEKGSDRYKQAYLSIPDFKKMHKKLYKYINDYAILEKPSQRF